MAARTIFLDEGQLVSRLNYVIVVPNANQVRNYSNGFAKIGFQTITKLYYYIEKSQPLLCHQIHTQITIILC